MAILDGEECDWCDQRAIDTCCGEFLCVTCLMGHDDDEERVCLECGDELGANFRTCNMCAEEY